VAAAEFVVVFVYDVERNQDRRRIAAILEQHGTRVQRSVFEVRTTLARAEALLRQLDRERGDDDGVRMYVLTEQGRERSRAVGGAPIPERSEFWLL
jgi:CRISPR-associated endonuclease Cas2